MRATRLTRVELEEGAVIVSGSHVIYGICVSNGSQEDVTVLFKDKDGASKIDIACQAHDTQTWDVSWIADNGLNISSRNLFYYGVVVTVAHGADGA